MLITPALLADCTRIAELAELSRSGFDPRAELERDFARLWVARESAQAPPVGFVLAWHAADEMHLLDLAVDPGARRRGLGRALVAAVVQHARERGARLVLLEVRRSNAPAIALYQTTGFSEYGVRRGYYSDNGEDAALMRLDLPPTTA